MSFHTVVANRLCYENSGVLHYRLVISGTFFNRPLNSVLAVCDVPMPKLWNISRMKSV
jgi:hypothetical protein